VVVITNLYYTAAGSFTMKADGSNNAT